MNALIAEGTSNATIAAWGTTLQRNMQLRAQDWSTAVFPCEYCVEHTGGIIATAWVHVS